MCPPRRQQPAPPPLPEARPTAPRPEETAKTVVVGSQRTTEGGKKRPKGTKRRLGTQSLRIPVTVSGNLRY
tara:strand:+ start:68 stop:280 length:213 start_codon:yes stop_codon:yes gene_type:complete